MGYLYIIGTILFTVYGQLVIKWRVNVHGSLPTSLVAKLEYLSGLLLDPIVLSGFLSAFIASVFWMAAMTKFDLSFSYPFMSLSFVLVFAMSVILFGEPVTAYKVAGLGLIVTGIIVMSR